MKTFKVSKLPKVLITSPLDIRLAHINNYKTVSENYVRAIAFDSSGIKNVEFRYKKEGLLNLWSAWVKMDNVAENIWQGSWNYVLLSNGEYELEARAIAKNENKDTHTTKVKIYNGKYTYVYSNSTK